MGLCSSNLNERIDHLSHTPFYIDMNDAQLREFAKIFRVVEFNAGYEIFAQEDIGDEFYVIGDGEVEITAADQEGNERFLCSKRRGDFFGEDALLADDQKRKSKVTTTQKCRMLVLAKRNFVDFEKKNVEISKTIRGIMGQRMIGNLKRIPFLKDLHEWKLDLLGSLFHYKSVPENGVVFSEGDLGTELYIVSQGLVKAFVLDDNGDELSLSEIKEGEYFGEIALMVDTPRTATIKALKRSLLLCLRKEDFNNFLQIVPDLKVELDKVVKQRTSEHFKKFKVPFFDAIPEDMYSKLADLAKIKKYGPDSIIFKEGDIGSSFYIIIYGQVSILRGDLLLDTFGPGRYFGEIALVRDTERSATVKTDQDCVILSIEKKAFLSFFSTAPEALAEFEIKLAREDVELKSILKHPLGFECFRGHLKVEFCEENLLCWEAVKEYRLLKNASEEQANRAKEIYQEFIKDGANQQVNVQSTAVAAISRQLDDEKVDEDLFNDVAHEVFKLMNSLTYDRFKESKEFKDFLDVMGSYENKEEENDEKDVKENKDEQNDTDENDNDKNIDDKDIEINVDDGKGEEERLLLAKNQVKPT